MIYVYCDVKSILSRDSPQKYFAKIEDGPFFRGKKRWAILLRHPGIYIHRHGISGHPCHLGWCKIFGGGVKFFGRSK